MGWYIKISRDSFKSFGKPSEMYTSFQKLHVEDENEIFDGDAHEKYQFQNIHQEKHYDYFPL